MNDPSWLRLQSLFDAAVALALLEARAILVATYPPDDNRRARIRERLRVLADRSGRSDLAVEEDPAG